MIIRSKDLTAPLPFQVSNVSRNALMKESFLTISTEQNIESVNLSVDDGKQILRLVQPTSNLV